MVSSISVEYVGYDNYYGFMIDGNERFVLGNFVVTHNTKIARCLANVLDYPFEQISFGGINQPEVLNGHDFTYIGSKPGMFVKKIVNMGCNNGILYMDEFEKITNPDVSSMLLQITDHTQNSEFVDNFLGDIKIDMSKLWFIYSMNNLPESVPLTDRLFVINVPGYTLDEKATILKDFIIPRQCKNIGINPTSITIDEYVARYFINTVCKPDDKGIRTIEKHMADIVNKIAFLVVNNNNLPVSFQFERKLEYPVNIDMDILRKVYKEEKQTSQMMMYI